MKVTSIPRIAGYRIFKDFTWKAPLEDFRRYNLIFGPNASGKTSLSCLFRLIEQKRPLPASDGVATFAFDGAYVNASEFDQRAVPHVRVFNRDTVKRSVFEDLTGELPPVFYLGEESVEKQKQVAQLKTKAVTLAEQMAASRQAIDTANSGFDSFCIESAKAIKNLLTASGSTYNTYDKANFKQTAERIVKSGQPPKPLDKQRRDSLLSLRSSSEKPLLSSLSSSLPDYSNLRKRVNELLSRTVTSELIAALVVDPEVARWVSEGLRLHQNAERCKFCNQTLPPDRLKGLEAHFNDRFRAFQAELDAVSQEIENSKSLLQKAPPSQAEFYEDMTIEYADCRKQLEAQLGAGTDILNALQRVIRMKKDRPFNPMEIGSTGDQQDPSAKALSDFSTLDSNGIAKHLGGAAIAACNLVIAKHNTRSGNHTKEVTDARKELEQHEVAARTKTFTSKKERIQEQENNLGELQAAARKAQTEIAKLEASIRTHQRPGQELTKEIAAYLGNTELTFEVKDNGYAIKRSDRPATNLSEGERTAIGFLYFLKSLADTNFNLSHGIVVVDDPVSSLDANSLYCAFGYLKAKCSNAAQLFILTHNFTFFRLARNWFHNIKPKDQVRFYMLGIEFSSGAREAKIAPLDPLLKEHESEYQYLFKCVVERSSATATGGDLASCYGSVNVARRVMEAFLAFKMPDSGPHLHAKLEAVTFDPAKKARILRFLHTGSHAGEIGEPEHDISVLSETPAVLTDLLEMIRSIDQVHYDGMRRKLGI